MTTVHECIVWHEESTIIRPRDDMRYFRHDLILHRQPGTQKITDHAQSPYMYMYHAYKLTCTFELKGIYCCVTEIKRSLGRGEAWDM